MIPSRTILVTLSLAALAGCGGGGGGDDHHHDDQTPPPGGSLPDWSTGPADCVDGMASEFPCSGVELLGRVPLDTMGGNTGNDLWAWTDTETGREYALVGLDNGAAFVDVTDPLSPVFLGRLPTRTIASTWRDIKVYQDHAYIVADGAGAHGMQIFDLTRLRGTTAPGIFNPDGVYLQFANAHNIAINEDTGFAYAAGTDSCGGGLHIIDIRTPNNPMFAGCHSPRYTHDTQCVTYQGPDTQFAGREICVSADENRLAINDVTRKSSPVTLASIAYPGMVYAHQGWLSEDHRYFFLGDELDELNLGVPTRTHVFDLAELTAPQHLYAHEADTPATDHNLYVHGNRLFQANYSVGLRVLEFGDLATGDIAEIAFFDTHPPNDARGFTGAWSVYPYLASGTVLVSDTRGGLFILALR